MKSVSIAGCFLALLPAEAVQGATRSSPDYLNDELTVEQVLDWGERPVWSPDGKKILFTKSDIKDSEAFELDVRTKAVQCLTCRWGVNGLVTRAFYLPDGSYLFLGPPELETRSEEKHSGVGEGTFTTELYWMPASGDRPPRALNASAHGDIAVSRKIGPGGRVALGWAELRDVTSRIFVADLYIKGDQAALTNRRIVYSYPSGNQNSQSTFAETYDVADEGKSITFWTMERGAARNGMYKVNIETGQTSRIFSDYYHNETHLFPNERFGLEESNRLADPSVPRRDTNPAMIAAVTGLLKRGGDMNRQPGPNLPKVGPGFDLFIRDLASADRIRQLTDISRLGGEAHQSAPSPDGRQIVYALLPPRSGPYAGKRGLFVGTFSKRHR